MSEKESINNKPQKEKKTLRRNLLEWFGILIVGAAMLFFFAPASWWQFGVSPIQERKNAANFTLTEIGGGEWNFAERRGKVVVVNYWATWCPPCRVETPGLVNLANEYKSRGVEVVGVTMDENLNDVPPTSVTRKKWVQLRFRNF